MIATRSMRLFAMVRVLLKQRAEWDEARNGVFEQRKAIEVDRDLDAINEI